MLYFLAAFAFGAAFVLGLAAAYQNISIRD
jgi:hypothetical protein